MFRYPAGKRNCKQSTNVAADCEVGVSFIDLGSNGAGSRCNATSGHHLDSLADSILDGCFEIQRLLDAEDRLPQTFSIQYNMMADIQTFLEVVEFPPVAEASSWPAYAFNHDN
jgi:hypothetical protein